jgi:hypothetical protein
VYELLIIDDNTIMTMLSSQAFLDEFPAVKTAANAIRTLSSCGRCQAKTQTDRSQIMNTLKSSLVTTSGPQLAKLKRLLNAKQLRLRVPQGNKLVEYTF